MHHQIRRRIDFSLAKVGTWRRKPLTSQPSQGKARSYEVATPKRSLLLASANQNSSSGLNENCAASAADRSFSEDGNVLCSFLSVKSSLSPVSAIWACSLVSLIFFEPFPLFYILVHSFPPLMNSCLQERKYLALVSHPFGWWFQFWIHFGRWWKFEFIIYFGRDDFVWLQRVLRIKLKFDRKFEKLLNDLIICFNDHFDSCFDLNSLKFGTSCYFNLIRY